MKKSSLTWLTLCLSILFLTIGIVQGQYHSVFTKAIQICLECIGIG